MAQRSSLQRNNINASSRTIGDITRAVLSLYRSHSHCHQHCPPTPGQPLSTLVTRTVYIYIYIYQRTHPSLSAIHWPAFNFLSCTLLRCSCLIADLISVAVSIDLSHVNVETKAFEVIEHFGLSHEIRRPEIERARAWLAMRSSGSSPATTMKVLSVFFKPHCITPLCILFYSLSIQASTFF